MAGSGSQATTRDRAVRSSTLRTSSRGGAPSSGKPRYPRIIVLVVLVVVIAFRRRPSPRRADFAKLWQVKRAMQQSWGAYERCASGEDEVLPLSCTGHRWFDMALTPVDSLDTLLMMGLEDEYLRAVDIIHDKASLRSSGNCNVFETTIRVLGGSLSGYFEAMASSNERVRETAASLLGVATKVGSRLLKAFDDSPTAIPLSDVDLSNGDTSLSAQFSSLSEMTTLALEFATLSNLTGDDRFRSAALGVYDALPTYGLLPRYFSPLTGEPADAGYVTLGARADSYYEYLLKYWIMVGGRKCAAGEGGERLGQRYRLAMDAIKSELLSYTKGKRQAAYISELKSGVKSNKMDHLVCFLPGMMALGYWHGANDASELRIAEDLLETCVMFYKNTPTGLAAEISYPNDEERGEFGVFDVRDQDAHNLLRPETVESLFILWAVTGKQKYRDNAWDIFKSFREHCGQCGPADGYCGIKSVKTVGLGDGIGIDDRIDKMESFWTAETLKYLWCIFSDVEVCGERILGGGWLLNTEAHWLPVLRDPSETGRGGPVRM